MWAGGVVFISKVVGLSPGGDGLLLLVVTSILVCCIASPVSLFV